MSHSLTWGWFGDCCSRNLGEGRERDRRGGKTR